MISSIKQVRVLNQLLIKYCYNVYYYYDVPCQVIEESMSAYINTKREEWVVAWPGQAVLCVSQCYWTKYVTESIRKSSDALKTYLELNNAQIDNIVTLVRGKLNKQNRTTLGALIVLDVHSRDVLTKLVKESKYITTLCVAYSRAINKLMDTINACSYNQLTAHSLPL